MSRTHDLRTRFWQFVPQANPDGRLTVIRVADHDKAILPGDFVLVSSRYAVRDMNLSSGQDILMCEHAPRTMAEIEAEQIEAVERNRSTSRQNTKTVPIPKWVHPDFHLEYRHVALRRGEEAAASAARKFASPDIAPSKESRA